MIEIEHFKITHQECPKRYFRNNLILCVLPLVSEPSLKVLYSLLRAWSFGLQKWLVSDTAPSVLRCLMVCTVSAPGGIGSDRSTTFSNSISVSKDDLTQEEQCCSKGRISHMKILGTYTEGVCAEQVQKRKDTLSKQRNVRRSCSLQFRHLCFFSLSFCRQIIAGCSLARCRV